MKILLVWPRNPQTVLSEELSCCEPLPLEQVAGSLVDRHDVDIIDLRLDPPLATCAVHIKPDLIGLAIPYTTMIPSALKTARELKRLWPEVPLLIGGHHPTMSAEWMNVLPADYVAVGEGGPATRNLADQLEKYGTLRTSIPNLVRLCDYSDKIAKPLLPSLAHLPPPNRSILHRHEQKYFHSIYKPVALMRFSAGCPYQCTFCSLWRLTDRRYITQSDERIVSELATLAVDNVYVVDDEAFIQSDRMWQLADRIQDAQIKKRYHMYLRADTAIKRPDVIERWAELGLDSVLVGAESMRQEELEEYEKGLATTETAKAVQLFHKFNIKVRANFIVQPSYGKSDFQRLADTVAALNIDLPSFSVLTPLPGTKLYENSRNDLIADNPELYDCYHSLFRTRLPLEEFYNQLSRLLEVTAKRQANPSESHHSMFYFSDQPAFQRMLDAVRNGHNLNAQQWNPQNEQQCAA